MPNILTITNPQQVMLLASTLEQLAEQMRDLVIDDLWYQTDDFQQMIAEAEADIAAGRTMPLEQVLNKLPDAV